MADSKKTDGGKKPVHQTRAEAAEALRLAAELIASLNETEEVASPSKKKPAASTVAKKSTAAKKPAASKASAQTKSQKSAAVKPAPKKTTAKKPAAKKATVKEEPVVEQAPPPEKEIAATDEANSTERPIAAAEPVAPVEQEPAPETVEQKEEPVAQTVEAAEPEPAPKNKVDEPVVAPVQVPEKAERKEKPRDNTPFKQKARNAVDKGYLPLFIIANALLALSAVLLIVSAFDISYIVGDKNVTEWYSVFGYFGNADIIKARLVGVAYGWANGGYALIGIMMVVAFLVPIALIIKNIILLIKNKDKRVSALDGTVSAAFITAYLGIVNLYGANITIGHVAALAVALILVAYTLFVSVLRGEGLIAAIFSASNIVLITLCMFLLTASPVYDEAGWYAASAASVADGAGVAFILLLATVAALVVMIVMQFKKLPAVVGAVIPAAVGVLSLIALILIAASVPDGLSIGAGFVCGAIITILLAALNLLFAFVPPLKRSVMRKAATAENAQDGNTEQSASSDRSAQDEQPEQTPADKPTEGPVKCPACGTENEQGSMFCMRCGKRL